MEGREYWRSLNLRLVTVGLVAAVLVAAFAAHRQEARYLLEPERHFERVALDRGTNLSAFPAISRAGLFYQAMVQSGYVLRWLHDGKMEEFAFEGQAFHPLAPSFDGPIYFELAKNGTSTTMTLDPATRQVAAAIVTPRISENSTTSPDGKWMAFESAQAGPLQIWLRDTLTGKTEVLTGGDCNSSSPAWEPDSRTLIFASDCGRGLGMPVLYRATLPMQLHPAK